MLEDAGGARITELERTPGLEISAQSSFSDSGLGGNNSDSEDIGRGEMLFHGTLKPLEVSFLE